jgi:hypothetical protein
MEKNSLNLYDLNQPFNHDVFLSLKTPIVTPSSRMPSKTPFPVYYYRIIYSRTSAITIRDLASNRAYHSGKLLRFYYAPRLCTSIMGSIVGSYSFLIFSPRLGIWPYLQKVHPHENSSVFSSFPFRRLQSVNSAPAFLPSTAACPLLIPTHRQIHPSLFYLGRHDLFPCPVLSHPSRVLHPILLSRQSQVVCKVKSQDARTPSPGPAAMIATMSPRTAAITGTKSLENGGNSIGDKVTLGAAMATSRGERR